MHGSLKRRRIHPTKQWYISHSSSPDQRPGLKVIKLFKPVTTKYMTHLPPRCWENMFVSLVVTSFDHFASMRLVFLLCRIRKKANIVVNVKIE